MEDRVVLRAINSTALVLEYIVLISLKKSLLSLAPPSFGRHVKSLVAAAFAIVSTHQSVLESRGGLWPVCLTCNP
jgi:hypothetical protein